MAHSSQSAEKLDFKRILPVIVIILVDLIGLSIIIPLLPLFAARFGANALVVGILQATYPLMQFIGAPVPFFAGGLILLFLWALAPRAIPKSSWGGMESHLHLST